ncbi:MAG: DUF3048 domain-containing protein [Lachnospiraceae bacterium]|nr:DUF3048 domain-containing protein [Lachnospiraceae bacterium]
MKKKSTALILSVAMIAALVTGCGKEKEETASEIQDITIYETIPAEEETVESETAEETQEAADSDEAPGEGYVRSSLTNEWVLEEVANSRPIAVMMPTDSEAQPQYNIGNAGVLYEAMEEGSISRQLAVIEGWQEMEKIGNVRSCRAYYIYPSMEWDSILVHFGGVFYMQDLITRSDVNNISGTNEYGTGGSAPGSNAFFRSSDKAAPHNAYISGENITSAMTSLGYEAEHRSKYWNADHFTFASSSDPNTLASYSSAKDATKVNLIDVFPVTKSYFEYDEESGTYLKWLHNSEQVDAVTGEQLAFDNIIIQFTESHVLDEKGYLAFDMLAANQPGYYVTKGKVIPIVWTKLSDYEPTKYYDENGNEIVLNTGKTYIAIAQNGTTPVFE